MCGNKEQKNEYSPPTKNAHTILYDNIYSQPSASKRVSESNGHTAFYASTPSVDFRPVIAGETGMELNLGTKESVEVCHPNNAARKPSVPLGMNAQEVKDELIDNYILYGDENAFNSMYQSVSPCAQYHKISDRSSHRIDDSQSSEHYHSSKSQSMGMEHQSNQYGNAQNSIFPFHMSEQHMPKGFLGVYDPSSYQQQSAENNVTNINNSIAKPSCQPASNQKYRRKRSSSAQDEADYLAIKRQKELQEDDPEYQKLLSDYHFSQIVQFHPEEAKKLISQGIIARYNPLFPHEDRVMSSFSLPREDDGSEYWPSSTRSSSAWSITSSSRGVLKISSGGKRPSSRTGKSVSAKNRGDGYSPKKNKAHGEIDLSSDIGDLGSSNYGFPPQSSDLVSGGPRGVKLDKKYNNSSKNQSIQIQENKYDVSMDKSLPPQESSSRNYGHKQKNLSLDLHDTRDTCDDKTLLGNSSNPSLGSKQLRQFNPVKQSRQPNISSPSHGYFRLSHPRYRMRLRRLLSDRGFSTAMDGSIKSKRLAITNCGIESGEVTTPFQLINVPSGSGTTEQIITSHKLKRIRNSSIRSSRSLPFRFINDLDSTKQVFIPSASRLRNINYEISETLFFKPHRKIKPSLENLLELTSNLKASTAAKGEAKMQNHINKGYFPEGRNKKRWKSSGKTKSDLKILLNDPTLEKKDHVVAATDELPTVNPFETASRTDNNHINQLEVSRPVVMFSQNPDESSHNYFPQQYVSEEQHMQQNQEQNFYQQQYQQQLLMQAQQYQQQQQQQYQQQQQQQYYHHEHHRTLEGLDYHQNYFTDDEYYPQPGTSSNPPENRPRTKARNLNRRVTKSSRSRLSRPSLSSARGSSHRRRNSTRTFEALSSGPFPISLDTPSTSHRRNNRSLIQTLENPPGGWYWALFSTDGLELGDTDELTTSNESPEDKEKSSQGNIEESKVKENSSDDDFYDSSSSDNESNARQNYADSHASNLPAMARASDEYNPQSSTSHDGNNNDMSKDVFDETGAAASSLNRSSTSNLGTRKSRYGRTFDETSDEDENSGGERATTPTFIPLQLTQPPLCNILPSFPQALEPDPLPRTRKQSKYTPEQDQKILDLKNKGITWAEIAELTGCQNQLAARNRYQVLIGQQGGGAYAWTSRECAFLQVKLDDGERAKWLYIAEELSRKFDRHFDYEAVFYQVCRLFAKKPEKFGLVKTRDSTQGGAAFERTELFDMSEADRTNAYAAMQRALQRHAEQEMHQPSPPDIEDWQEQDTLRYPADAGMDYGNTHDDGKEGGRDSSENAENE